MTSDRRSILRGTSIVACASIFGSPTAVGSVTASEDGRTTVAGRVTDFGQPVEAATVAFESQNGSDGRIEIETDDRGRYERALEPGEYALVVRADGYADERTTVVVGDGETETVDATLGREWGPDTGELDVYATEVGGGSTIPCEITVYGDERYRSEAPLGSIPDDENWGRGFVVNEGWWEVLVTEADGYSDGYQEVYVEGGETAFAHVELPEGDDEISREGTIEGRVTDENGEPIANAWVDVDGRLVSVDADGAFELELENGHYELTANASEYERASGTVRVGFGTTSRIDVTLQTVAGE